MSFETEMATIGNDVKGFFSKLATDYKRARAAWTIISSPQTRSALITIGGDAIKAVKDSEAAASIAGMSITLDVAVVADIRQLIMDAKAGDGVLVADLKMLGITL